MAFHPVVAGDTVAIEVGIGSAVVVFRTAPRKRNRMVLRNARAQHFAEPVGIGRIIIVYAHVLSQLFVGVAPFGSGEHVGLVGYPVHRDVAVVLDLRFRTRTSFGGNQNHAAGGPRSVNSGRRGVFQDGNRFDVGGGDGRHVAARNAVDHDHGALVVLQRGGTAQPDLRAARHVARTGGDGEPGYFAL